MRDLVWTFANTKNNDVKFALSQTSTVGLGIMTRVKDRICVEGFGSGMENVPMVRGLHWVGLQF